MTAEILAPFLPRKHGSADDGLPEGVLGGRLARIDGPAKVTGAAAFSLEHRPEGLVYMALVRAPVAAGALSVDAEAARAAPGVVAVLTPETFPALAAASDWTGAPGPEGPWRPIGPEARWMGQPVAAVVAETWEEAAEAAALVRISGEDGAAFASDLHAPDAPEGFAMEPADIVWGDADAALAGAETVIEATYRTPREHHVAIEPHGMIAQWDGERLTIHEPSQWVDGMARAHAERFGIPFENVRIVSPYIGGGFGSKAMAYAWSALAIQAARDLARPVKLALTRAQTFTALGGRAATRSTLRIGADADGKLVGIDLNSASETSLDAIWPENPGPPASEMYAVPNFRARHRLVRVNSVTPGALRAPGESPGAFGLECAMDELAWALRMDPLSLRLKNYAETDPRSGKPWSTRRLREAFAAGAERFGWWDRPLAPRQMREGRELIGWGMASGAFPVINTPAEARVRIGTDGRAEVLSGGTEMGQGTYTILAQTAAEAIGLPAGAVSVRLGDSELPGAPVSGGSQLANLMTGAVMKAARAARDELVALALTHPDSPLRDAGNDLEISAGRLRAPRDGGEGVSIADLFAATGAPGIDVLRDTLPEGSTAQDRFETFTTVTRMGRGANSPTASMSWIAHFAEVRVDEDFGTVRLSRLVSAVDAGRLYNPRLAESQVKGGAIMGIGMALLEEGVIDRRFGRAINDNLGDYLAPTQADVPGIEVIDVGVPDYDASALGGKAVGEIGIVGVAPAIANAVFHATGKRIRDLPITLEKVLETPAIA